MSGCDFFNHTTITYRNYTKTLTKVIKNLENLNFRGKEIPKRKTNGLGIPKSLKNFGVCVSKIKKRHL